MHTFDLNINHLSLPGEVRVLKAPFLMARCCKHFVTVPIPSTAQQRLLDSGEATPKLHRSGIVQIS